MKTTLELLVEILGRVGHAGTRRHGIRSATSADVEARWNREESRCFSSLHEKSCVGEKHFFLRIHATIWQKPVVWADKEKQEWTTNYSRFGTQPLT